MAQTMAVLPDPFSALREQWADDPDNRATFRLEVQSRVQPDHWFLVDEYGSHREAMRVARELGNADGRVRRIRRVETTGVTFVAPEHTAVEM